MENRGPKGNATQGSLSQELGERHHGVCVWVCVCNGGVLGLDLALRDF